MRTISKTLYLMGLITTVLSLISCKKMQKEKKYEYNITVSGSKLYPVQVYRGFLGTPNSSYSLAAGGQYESPWGSNCSTMNTWEMRYVPTHLSVVWFSMVETKFYAANVELPPEKIRSLLEEEYVADENGYVAQFTSIVIGMAPGGTVVVWLFGPGQRQVEVTASKGFPVDVTMKEFQPSIHEEMTLEEYSDLSQYEEYNYIYENLEKNAIETELFEQYRERFNVKMRFDFETEGLFINSKSMEFLNGEKECYFFEDAKIDYYTPRARMKFMYFRWFVPQEGSDNKDAYTTRVWFHKDELFRVYSEMFQNDPKKEVEFVTHIGKYYNEMEFYLTDGERRVYFDTEYIKLLIRKTSMEKTTVHFMSENYVHYNSISEWDPYSD